MRVGGFVHPTQFPNTPPASVVDTGVDPVRRCQVCGKPLPTDKRDSAKNCSNRCNVRACQMRSKGLPVDTPRRQQNPNSPHSKAPTRAQFE